MGEVGCNQDPRIWNSRFVRVLLYATLCPFAMAIKLAPESRSGSASSTCWLGFDVGMALGMLFFGAVIGSGASGRLFSSAQGLCSCSA